MVGLHVIEYLLRVPWVWGIPWGFQWALLWVWDGCGDWNAIPTAALLYIYRLHCICPSARNSAVLESPKLMRMLRFSHETGVSVWGQEVKATNPDKRCMSIVLVSSLAVERDGCCLTLLLLLLLLLFKSYTKLSEKCAWQRQWTQIMHGNTVTQRTKRNIATQTRVHPIIYLVVVRAVKSQQESPANAKGTRDSSACMKAHCEQM